MSDSSSRYRTVLGIAVPAAPRAADVPAANSEPILIAGKLSHRAVGEIEGRLRDEWVFLLALDAQTLHLGAPMSREIALAELRAVELTRQLRVTTVVQLTLSSGEILRVAIVYGTSLFGLQIINRLATIALYDALKTLLLAR